MLKKFVPLNSPTSPSRNPYEVRTFNGVVPLGPEWTNELCTRFRKCDEQENSTISKVLTIEDEIRRLNQRAKDSRFSKPFKVKCEKFDPFLACVVPQRTPKELKKHAVMRERYLQTQYQMGTRVHEGKDPKLSPVPSLVALASPIQIQEEEDESELGEEEDEDEDAGQVKPLLASPECSLDAIYIPPKSMLALKRPKSGLFINESEEPKVPFDEIPYSNYNPRQLQKKFDSQNLGKIDIIEGVGGNEDLWTWNLSMQEGERQLDRVFIEATIPKLDCDNMELTVFKIPKDLDKTFTAEIVFGNEAVSLAPEPKRKQFYNRPKEIACLYIAFVESYRLNPDFWTAETMDAILVSADKLLNKSTKINYKSKENDFDIIPQIADRNAAVGLKVHFTGPLENEPNIYKALSLYFSKFNAAILCSKNLFLLIWKRCQNSFYVFDPNGRNELCQRDFEEGKCSLMATRFVEHLVHLIINFSDTDMHGEFNLYEIFLTNYGKLTTTIPKTPLPKRTRRLWAVVNNKYAIIPAANNGLHQPVTGNEQNPSIIICLLTLLYSDMERAINWRPDILDDLIRYGQAYNKHIRKSYRMKKKGNINITELPDSIMLGTYKATMKKRPFLYTGHVADCKNYLDSQLIVAIKELFGSNWEAALLQIDNSFLAIWRDKEYFYVFDPFRRGRAGQVLDPDDYLTKGYAVLQLHTNFESFCRMMYNKAIKMRRGGKFFIHGVNVGCIKPIPNDTRLDRRHKFPTLFLNPVKYYDNASKSLSELLSGSRSKITKVKTGKGKNGKVERKYSIQSIPEEEIIPEFDDAEVVETLIEELLCDILKLMEEPYPGRPPCYRQADKILLRSDKTYLESLKYKLKHGEDYDNVYSAFRTVPDPQIGPPMKIEEELQIPSNYQILPDSTWVIFGTSQLPAVNDEISKLSGLLAGLVTVALSAKYKISTWNSDLVEYALEAVNTFGEAYQNYELTLASVLSKKIPKISIGETIYQIQIDKIIKSTFTRSLRQLLLESLMQYNRLMVICQRFSCVIFKRYNFLYMFVGFPCNTVGYRRFGTGPGCMLRFLELDSLIRRIEFGCNPQGCEITNYVVLALKVVDLTDIPAKRFKQYTEDDETKMYREEYDRLQNIHKSKMEKMKFLDRELRKEDKRIKRFLEEKERRADYRRNRLKISRKCQAGEVPQKDSSRKYEEERSRENAGAGSYSSDDEDEMFVDEEGEYEEEDNEIALKHIPGKRLPIEKIDQFKPRPVVYGYRMRNKDCLFKIQGSKALPDRASASITEIKPCFFASTLAILYAILRPLNQWTSQRVDHVIDSCNSIVAGISNMTTAFERIIEGVTVDFYTFNLWIKTYQPPGTLNTDIAIKLLRVGKKRRYLLLQLSNCTFALFFDEYYHLFDPYGSMEKAGEGEEEEEPEKKKCPKGTKRYAERNTASWILFPDPDELLKYIDARAANSDWRKSEEYKFHVVDIISYKKAAASKRILQLLTDLSVPMECNIAQAGDDETTVCAHNECLSWLDLDNCLPVWSRMNRRNTSGLYRNLPITKHKKYDIEIEGRLWSLWGNLHPQAPVFPVQSRGKQYLACNVIACCAARVYNLSDWSSLLLDTIVISGDKYHRESLENIDQEDYEFSLEDLNLECMLESIKFVVHLEHVAYGKLYATPSYTRMNLAEALMYFFGHYQFGILQCYKRCLAIGRTFGHDGGYFMFDCQGRDHPLFPKGQGAAYILRTKYLQVLLYCIVITLNIPYFNVQFSLHTVDMLRDGADVVEEEGEEEEN